MFRDHACFRVCHEQTEVPLTFPTFPGDLTQRECEQNFPFCFTPGSPKSQRIGKLQLQYPKHDASWCPSEGNVHSKLSFIPTCHSLQMIKSQPQGKSHLKKNCLYWLFLEKLSFPGKVTFLVREEIKINAAQAKMTFESKQKFAFCFSSSFLLIIHWCAKKNSPDLAFHKPFGVVHIYSLSWGGSLAKPCQEKGTNMPCENWVVVRGSTQRPQGKNASGLLIEWVKVSDKGRLKYVSWAETTFRLTNFHLQNW